MSSQHAPHRIRARYLRALKAMPMPVNLIDPPDPARLTVLGTEPVGGRMVRFGTVASAPRLWMALGEPTEAAEITRATGATETTEPGQATEPTEHTEAAELGQAALFGQATGPGHAAKPGQTTGPLLGYVTGLVVGEPDLWVCEGVHREWVLDAANAQELKRAASRVWFSCIEECEG